MESRRGSGVVKEENQTNFKNLFNEVIKEPFPVVRLNHILII